MQGSEKKRKKFPYFRNPVENDQDTEFLCTEITYVIDDEPYWGPVLRLYGVNASGNSVCCKVRNFQPYFYSTGLVDDLENKIREKRDNKKVPKHIQSIVSVEAVKRQPLMGYSPNGQISMYKITLSSPKFVPIARNFLESAGHLTYEASTLYELRFMVDKGFGGCDWLRPINVKPTVKRETTCQLEFECDNVIKFEQEKRPQIRGLSFDFECCKLKGRGFVDAEIPTDPIICIGNTLYDGDDNMIDERTFCWGGNGTALPIPRGEVESFSSERDMLVAWMQYIVDADPDWFTGYNIDGFDWPYFVKRCKYLKIPMLITREIDLEASIRKSSFSSAATGQRNDYQMITEGRFSADMLKYVKAPSSLLKFRSYTLNAVSKIILDESKVEMPYSKITPYFLGTDEQRRHLNEYVQWDSYLPYAIGKAKMVTTNYIETARVCGVLIKYLYTRGQQILTMALLLFYCQRRGLVVPSSTDNENDEETDGATVKNPVRGVHVDPIITLDFQSLYPSIIRHRNYCYSTIVSLRWARDHLKREDYFIPPNIPNIDFCFVKEHIWKGILPEIETTLFNKRNAAKADMKREQDPAKKEVLNARQNAIKMRMNAIYGFMKANMVCDKRLMLSVTGEGRYMLEETTRIVEEAFPGIAKVIYGDTDSVFVKFVGKTITEAFEYGQRAADMCTQFFNAERVAAGLESIHLLQREKGFTVFILFGKKKYAGRKQLTLQSKPELSCSGIETVRRDNASIASDLLQDCLETMVMEGDFTLPPIERLRIQKDIAIKKVHQTVRELLTGRTPMHKLIISKNISKSFQHYEDTMAQLPHIELAKKIDARKDQTGEQPYAVGDRVKYVMVCGPKKEKKCNLAEDPLFAMQNNMQIDYEYYLYDQLMKPIMKLFTPIINPNQSMVKVQGAPKYMLDSRDKVLSYTPQVVHNPWLKPKKLKTKAAPKTLNLKDMKRLDSFRILFEGEHMMHKVQTTITSESSMVGITGWARALPSCIECRCRLPDNKSPLCRGCAPKGTFVYMKMQQRKSELEMEYWDLWTGCQRCDGKFHGNIECENKDCEKFYQRIKVAQALRDVQKRMENF